MFKKLYRPGQRNALPPQAIIAFLAVLALLVGGLAVYAVQQGGTSSAPGLPTSSAQPPTAEPSTPVPTEEPSAEPTEEPTDEPTPEEPETPAEITAVVPDRLMTSVNNDLIVRSSVGTCQSPGTFEVSKDGGDTWNTSSSFADTGATMVLRVIPTRATLIQVVALDSDCNPQLWRTANQGSTWQASIAPDGAWFFNPEEPNSVYAPDGKVTAPCEVTYMAASGDGAAVLCTDSSIITTDDKAATWNDPLSVLGAIALNVSDANYIVAVANQNECTGLQTLTLEGSSVGAPSTCLETELEQGSVSVARTVGSVFTWYGDDFAVSSNGGSSWQQ